MKYNLFKILKFSTITKKINIIGYNFSRNLRKVKFDPKIISDFFVNFIEFFYYKIKKTINIIVKNILNFYKKLSFRKFGYKKIYTFFNIKKHNLFSSIKKKAELSLKVFLFYFFCFLIFFVIIYVTVPAFYSYDSIKVSKFICINKNIECSIKGKVNYSFFPTPRIKIKDLSIKESSKKDNILMEAKEVSIQLSIKNILNKKKQSYKKIEFTNFNINFDFKDLKKYKSFLITKNNYIPVIFKKGKIIFSDGDDYVGIIENVKLNTKIKNNFKKTVLKGIFLNDDLYISLIDKKLDNKKTTDIVLKISNYNLLVKANLFNIRENLHSVDSNVLIKKGRNKFTGILNYKDNKLTIKKSNLRNSFSDGKLLGYIKFLPYFDFNLDLSLSSLNFTKLYNLLLALDTERQKNLFKVSNKINGVFNLSSDKIYSSHNLVKSFESQIKLNNGNILIEQFLVNLGKLGAADLVGNIKSDKKFINFKYESNIFVDNQKKFISKFGIYNKKEIPPNFFVAGNFDLKNFKSSFYEISTDEKLPDTDVDFVEDEFNSFMLSNGYQDLFRFAIFKKFIKSFTSEIK